jgi:hypothetical protein
MRIFTSLFLALFCLGSLVGGCASTDAAKNDAEAGEQEEGIRPVFAWKPGWTFKVKRQSVERTKEADGQMVAETVKMDFRARLTGYDKDSLLLTYDQYENLVVDTPEEQMDWKDLSPDDQATLNLTYTRATPALVIGRDGAFKNALKAEGALTFIQDLHEEDMTPETRAKLENLVTADVIQNAARNEWAVQVELWTQRAYPPGQMFRSEFQGPHPLAPGVLVKNVMTFGLEQTTPCPNDEKRQCGAFVMILESDPQSMEAVIDNIFKEFAPKNPDGTLKDGFKLKAIKNRVTHTLIADLETLQPFVQRKVTEVRVDAEENGNDASTMRETQMTTGYYLQ